MKWWPWKKKTQAPEESTVALRGQPVEVNPPAEAAKARRESRLERLELALKDASPHSPKRGALQREIKRLRLLGQAEEV